ncbi:unnamed protein product [Rotaria sp. Silwood1]|nr:unnamed protein product [Rotaria sp. Silwood1]
MKKKSTKPPITKNENSHEEIKSHVRKSSHSRLNQSEIPLKIEPESNTKQKKSSNIESASALINSSISSSSSLATSNIDEYHTDFLMAVDMKTTIQTVVEFSPVNNNLFVVNTKKEPNEYPDRQEIIRKLVAFLGNQNIFKKRTSLYNESIHGSLYLIVFYGHIYFFQNKFPDKLGPLKKYITAEESNKIIRFNYANFDKLNISESSHSTTKKNKIDYEFDCYVNSSPSEYITLLYDKNKILQQIRVYYKWSKCFVRQPNFNVDSLYEIRSVLTHESNSSEFTRIMKLIFKNQSTELFNGRKPNIKIDRSILLPSVIPISLKIIEEDQEIYIDQSNIESFYRKVKYVSIDEQEEKPKVYLTMEYHVSSMNKIKGILEQVCDFALSPTEKTSLVRQYSTSSTASTTLTSLQGFSIFSY